MVKTEKEIDVPCGWSLLWSPTAPLTALTRSWLHFSVPQFPISQVRTVTLSVSLGKVYVMRGLVHIKGSLIVSHYQYLAANATCPLESASEPRSKDPSLELPLPSSSGGAVYDLG